LVSFATYIHVDVAVLRERERERERERAEQISILCQEEAGNIGRIKFFNISYAFNASFSVRHSDGIQAVCQAGGILFIAVWTPPKGLISTT
jgi:hypothetical protein